MSRFSETMYGNALSSRNGMTTGEPYAPVRHSWHQVHQRARRVAGGLASAASVMATLSRCSQVRPSKSHRPRKAFGCGAQA
ncbi:hypothetical protein MYXE_25040 [Mycobacterium xenopi]|uniref:Uncharacterized protein n=1 Tax=Mycobacterium xenopi TaxID=1789 RepID=A0AAD1H092_MYCXE|nr:hypothetical protein MYXE_25040 [Mycobacterium xenopi]